MKIRIVEYRHDPRQEGLTGSMKSSNLKVCEYEDPLSYEDPHVTEGWVHLLVAEEPLKCRARMFYNVESVTQVSDEMDNANLPGQSFELKFDTGETLTIHNTVLAESEAEVEVTSA